MTTTMTVKGQVTIPKKVREALRLSAGDGVDFDVNRDGQVVVQKAAARATGKRDRFESARGKAQVKWRTDDLMALLRATDQTFPLLLVDTNVPVDVLEDDPTWANWSVGQLRAQAQVHQLFINPVIYSELSLAFDSVSALDDAIEGMALSYEELPRPALFLAGRAFVQYRREGGAKANCTGRLFQQMSGASAVAQRALMHRRSRMPGVR